MAWLSQPHPDGRIAQRALGLLRRAACASAGFDDALEGEADLTKEP